MFKIINLQFSKDGCRVGIITMFFLRTFSFISFQLSTNQIKRADCIFRPSRPKIDVSRTSTKQMATYTYMVNLNEVSENNSLEVF